MVLGAHGRAWAVIIKLAMPTGKLRMLWGAKMGREMKWPASMEVSDILAWKRKMLVGG
jgi:hypothetical protein